MRVVKPEQALARWRMPRWPMQRESVAQSMRALCRHSHTLDLELQPISLIEHMDAPIEREQKSECVIVRNRLYPFLS